jgi:hypothetical protein
LAGIALAIAGCAIGPQRSDQEIVAEKAQLRWNALVAGDFKAAYGFISPAGRSVVTVEGYSGTLKRGFWKDVRVEDVKCASPEICEVQLRIEYEFQGRRIKTPASEKWVKQDSDWWFLLQI